MPSASSSFASRRRSKRSRVLELEVEMLLEKIMEVPFSRLLPRRRELQQRAPAKSPKKRKIEEDALEEAEAEEASQ
jgi:hypothetical protein